MQYIICWDGMSRKRNTLNKTNMGRYISTGIIYQYGFAKSSIPGIESQEVKQQVIEQLFPEIYDFREDESYFYLTLSSSLSASDLISAMEAYYSLTGLTDEESDEYNQVKQLLEGKTIAEAYTEAEEKQSYLYSAEELGYNYSYYGVPLVINGIRKYYPVHVWIIMIDQSSAKTITEDDLFSYRFFTTLLRYRMKPEKLADAMLIFLSA